MSVDFPSSTEPHVLKRSSSTGCDECPDIVLISLSRAASAVEAGGLCQLKRAVVQRKTRGDWQRAKVAFNFKMSQLCLKPEDRLYRINFVKLPAHLPKMRA